MFSKINDFSVLALNHYIDDFETLSYANLNQQLARRKRSIDNVDEGVQLRFRAYNR